MVNAVAAFRPFASVAVTGKCRSAESPQSRLPSRKTKELAHVGKDGLGEIIRNCCGWCAAGGRGSACGRNPEGQSFDLQIYQVGERGSAD